MCISVVYCYHCVTVYKTHLRFEIMESILFVRYMVLLFL